MKKGLVIVAALFAAMAFASAQTPLPNDPATKVGKLDNGMTYYIRHNDKPAQRAEFYLATHVGAIQETPDQDGLAHFLEHMCFNGLKNLPGKQMLEYLQSIGAEFGRNINASTGVEVTQYMLNNIPVTRPGIVDTCLLIMHDYSHYVLNEPEEIDAERGVIIEERRTRRNASWRMREQNFQYIFKDSKYADCTIIGTQENLETFKPESLVNFYQTWYRPDNQALIIVGDLDVDEIEAKIKTLFADIPAPVDPKAKDVIKVPGNAEPIVGIVTDPEASNSEVTIIWKSDPLPREMNNTDVALMMDLLKSLIGTVMDERFQDITSKPDAPFLVGQLGFGDLCETVDAMMGSVGFKEGATDAALEAFYTEIEKMKRYGFTEAELQRAKDEIISRYERRAEGADSRQNAEFIRPIISNFFYNSSFMEPATAVQLVKMILPQLQKDMVNQVVSQMVTEENIVILYNGPEKEGLANPTAEEILGVIAKVKASEIAAPEEEKIDSQLIDPATLKGSKVKKTAPAVKGFTEWTLANGVKVAWLPTDYKKDEIRINLVLDGGESLVSDEDLNSLESNIIQLFTQNSGVSKYSRSTLNKMLAGKQVNMNPYFGSVRHGISGSCQPKDLETALQLLYLEFTDPRFDADEWAVGIGQIKAVLPNLLNAPNFKFQQELTRTMYGSNPRNIILSEEVLEKASLATVEKNYRKLFASASGARVYIVGNFTEAELKPLVEKYIGSLPKGKKPLKWVDTGERFAQGHVENVFSFDMQTPQTTVFQAYNSYGVKYNVADEVNLDAVSYILDNIYTETLREEEGGTYGASTSTQLEKYPVDRALVQVYFNTNPSSADKLRALAVKGLKNLAEEGPTAEQLTRVRENFAKNVPENRIRNNYWMTVISTWYNQGIDYDAEYEAAVAALSADGIKNALAKVLASGNFVEVVMVPGATAERE